MNRVLIYRSRLLPISETFIRAHYDSLLRWRPIFAGLRKVHGISISDTNHILLEAEGRSTGRLAAFKLLGWGPDFVNRIVRAKPDLIHAHFAVDAVDMLPLAHQLNIPLIVTLHGYDVTFTDAAFRALGAEGRNYLLKRKRLFREADLFLPVSEFIHLRGLHAGLPSKRCRVHYLGVNLKKLPQTNRLRENTVLYVGRLVEKKGLNLLIEAMALAGANEDGYTLRVIGDGPMRDAFLEQAHQKLKNFDYLGAQPHQRVVFELSRARIFSVPSVPSSSGDNEGLPISHLEASAMGVPVVSSAQGGILEAVVDEETGLLSSAGNIEALAANLRRLFASPELCERLGRAGRVRVAAIFNEREQAAQLEGIYDEVTTRR